MEPSQAAELVCKSCTCTLKEIETRKIEEEIEDEKVEDCKSEEPVAEEDSTDDSDEEEPEEPVEKISLSYISWMSDEELAPEIELRNKKVDQQKRKRKLASPGEICFNSIEQLLMTFNFRKANHQRTASASINQTLHQTHGASKWFAKILSLQFYLEIDTNDSIKTLFNVNNLIAGSLQILFKIDI